jgi:glucose-1-phosphate cytidylyltransferase
MKVVILCDGKGTRLREETEYRPKPMLEYRGDTLRRFTRKATA